MKISRYEFDPALPVILLVAIILRSVWAAFVPVIPISDGEAYAAFARTLAEHGVFGWTKGEPSSFWPPGTSLLHALVYKTFGIHETALVVLNILLSAGIILVSVRIVARFYERRTAVIVGAILALWPSLIMYPTILASELPFLFFTLAALDVWTSSRGSPVTRGAFCGLLLGFAALVRPLALMLPFLYAATMWFQGGRTAEVLKTQVKTLALVLPLMAVTIAPWTWRNHQLHGEPVLISTNGGVTFWMGNNPQSPGDFINSPPQYRYLPEAQKEEALSALAWQYIIDDPVAFIGRSLKKLALLYGNESIAVMWNMHGIEAALGEGAVQPLKRFAQAAWVVILFSSLLGVVLLVRREGFWRTMLSPMVAMIALFSAIYAITVAQHRYHLSFASQLALLSAVGFVAIARAVAAKNWRELFR